MPPQAGPRRLPVSALARMKAQLAIMPVIEQAKGILVARAGCNPGKRSTSYGCIAAEPMCRNRVLAACLAKTEHLSQCGG